MSRAPIVTLTTDFGTVDGYVGAMKGVILARAPGATIVDISHSVPRHDIAAGAFALAQATPHFPPGTIHVAVVDPGVGGARAPVILEANDYRFVGPDNGLFSLVAPVPDSAYRISAVGFRRPNVSVTFQGRDVFAAAAGRLAAGASSRDAGPEVDSLESLALPHADAPEGALCATVVHVDAFGNLITDLNSDQLSDAASFRIAGRDIAQLSLTFESVVVGELMAYIGSGNTIEIAVREGSATEFLGVGRGALVVVLGGDGA